MNRTGRLRQSLSAYLKQSLAIRTEGYYGWTDRYGIRPSWLTDTTSGRRVRVQFNTKQKEIAHGLAT